jgi:pimeloyl-ACP methyl ester carboxylesterase
VEQAGSAAVPTRRSDALAAAIAAGHDGPPPPQRVAELFNDLPAEDRAVLERPEVREILTATTIEAFRQGTRGAVHDIGLEAQPWEVDLAAITSAVEIWHGRKDTLVSSAQGEILAREISTADTHFVPEEGHISLLIGHFASILRAFT